MPIEVILTPDLIPAGEPGAGTSGEAFGPRGSATPVDEELPNTSHAAAEIQFGWTVKSAERLTSFHNFGPTGIPRGSTVNAANIEVTPSLTNAAACDVQIGILNERAAFARWPYTAAATVGQVDLWSGVAIDVYAGETKIADTLTLGVNPALFSRTNVEVPLSPATATGGIYGVATGVQASLTGAVTSIWMPVHNRSPVTPEDRKPGHYYWLEIWTSAFTGANAFPGSLLESSDAVQVGDLPESGFVEFTFSGATTMTAGTWYVVRLNHTNHSHDATDSSGISVGCYRAGDSFWPDAEYAFYWAPSPLDASFHVSNYLYDYQLPWATGGNADTVTRPSRLYASGLLFSPWASNEFSVLPWTADVPQRWGDGYGGETVSFPYLRTTLQAWLARSTYDPENSHLGITIDPHNDPVAVNVKRMHSSSNPAKTGMRLFIKYTPPAGAVRIRSSASRRAVSSDPRVRPAVSLARRARASVALSERIGPAVTFSTRVRPALSITSRVNGG